MEGGVAHFPGLARPFTVDTTTLSAEEGAHAAAMVTALGEKHEKGASRAPVPGAADLRQYTLTIEDGSRSRTLRLSDPLTEPEQALVSFLRAKQRGQPSQGS
jgi:hypothetical protein